MSYINIQPQSQYQNLEKVFWSVFRTIDTFDNDLFQSHCSERIVLCPTANTKYGLSEQHYNALLLFLRELGEEEFIISELGCKCFQPAQYSFQYECQHWVCKANCPYSDYSKLKISFENAIYSYSGKWGIIISHEWSGAFGGEPACATIFKKMYPNWENDLVVFREEWNKRAILYKSDITWIDAFLQQFTSYSP
jgi:hypothetical protein